MIDGFMETSRSAAQVEAPASGRSGARHVDEREKVAVTAGPKMGRDA